MNWASVADFFAMGGYAGYVWGSFGVTVGVLLCEVLALRARRKALQQRPPSISKDPHET